MFKNFEHYSLSALKAGLETIAKMKDPNQTASAVEAVWSGSSLFAILTSICSRSVLFA